MYNTVHFKSATTKETPLSKNSKDRTQPGLIVFLLGLVARDLEGTEEKSVRAIGDGGPVGERRGLHSHDVDAIAIRCEVL